MDTGFISVIIPAKNAANLLPDCINAVSHQEPFRPGLDFEIILVDDGSEDGSAEVGSKLGVNVVSQPNAGPASARNHGARVADGEILAFTDADCIPAPGWLEALTTPFQDSTVAGVKGVYRTRETGLIPRFVQLEYEEHYHVMNQLERIDFIDTYSAAYRKEVFLNAGGFNEVFRVPSVEDQELSFRLADQGQKLVFQSQAAVYHRHDLNIQEYAVRKFGIGYWKAIMLRWLPERALRDTYTPASLRWQLPLAGLALMFLLTSPFWTLAIYAAGFCLLSFILSTLPLHVFAARKDPGLLPILLPLLLIRAFSLGFGLVFGTLAGMTGRWMHG